jgi:hypothetical protein
MFEYTATSDTWWERLRANLKSRKPWRFVLALAFSTAGIIGLLMGTLAFMPLPLFGGLLSLGLGGYFFTTWHRCQELTVQEAMEKDPRRPILYLRPFKADKLAYETVQSKSVSKNLSLLGIGPALVFFAFGVGRPKRAEELIVDILDPLGPVIAIGRPSEKIPYVGAARLYVGDQWKDVVQEFMKRSQLIVMVAGSTPNFTWEIGQVFRNTPFVKTIILLPFFKKHEPTEVERFVVTLAQCSGLSVPNYLGATRAIYFPDRDSISLIEEGDSPTERELNEMNPFLASLARILRRDEPRWGEEYLASVHEINAETRRNAKAFFWVWFAIQMLFRILSQ